MTSRKDLRREVPVWWRDAKLGIFVHWTPASVAGFAPTGREIGELLASTALDTLAETPYTEWYANSLRFPDSSAARHHRETFGDRPYEAFADDFRDALALWDPTDWARRFAATGARYVVLVTKHHDGFCLWPSEVHNPHVGGWHTGRDVVGELREAVLGEGLRFGVYYSGGLDWTFDPRPIGNIADAVRAQPRGAYPAYADAQVRELIARYRPSVLWNDISWPGSKGELFDLFAHYYDVVPDGVVNDRWVPYHPALRALEWGPARTALIKASAKSAAKDGLVPPTPPHYDVRTPEYAVFDDIQSRPWECVRGIDRSFGYNAASDESMFLTRDDLASSLVDIASKNGNLLLNVGPRGIDAAIPDAQRLRLDWLADLDEEVGDALHGTRPWVRPGAVSAEGNELRFTVRDRTVFVVALGPVGASLTVPGVLATPTTEVESLDGTTASWEATPGGLRIEVDPDLVEPDAPAVAFALRDVDAGPSR